MTGQARVILRTSVSNLTISHEKDTKWNLTSTTTTLIGFYQRNCGLRYENLQTNAKNIFQNTILWYITPVKKQMHMCFN